MSSTVLVKDVIYMFNNDESKTLQEIHNYVEKNKTALYNKGVYQYFSIGVESYSDYGACCPSTRTCIYGHRPETSIERDHRLKEEAKKAKEQGKINREREKWEKQQLKILLKKYPDLRNK